MSEKEKSIASKIASAIPKMSEFKKGYLLGAAEALADENVREENERNNDGSGNGTED